MNEYTDLDIAIWRQYHPNLQNMWQSQISAYRIPVNAFPVINSVYYKRNNPENIGLILSDENISNSDWQDLIQLKATNNL